MPLDLKTYAKLKAAAEEAQREADKAEGAFEQAMKALEKDFGCTSIGEARQLLADLEKREAKAVKAFNTALAEFEEKWREVYGDE